MLSKALALNLPAVVMLNKVDRPDARPDAVIDEVFQLFFDLGASDHHIEFPIVSTIARQGRSVAGVGVPAEDDDLSALLDMVVAAIPLRRVIRMHRCRRSSPTSTPPTISAASPLDVWCAARCAPASAWRCVMRMRMSRRFAGDSPSFSGLLASPASMSPRGQRVISSWWLVSRR